MLNFVESTPSPRAGGFISRVDLWEVVEPLGGGGPLGCTLQELGGPA
jgi:hypothetical protein